MAPRERAAAHEADREVEAVVLPGAGYLGAAPEKEAGLQEDRVAHVAGQRHDGLDAARDARAAPPCEVGGEAEALAHRQGARAERLDGRHRAREGEGGQPVLGAAARPAAERCAVGAD